MVNTALFKFLNNNSIRCAFPVITADLVSFKVGGLGKLAVFPNSLEELQHILCLVNGEKFVLLGKGTNCYFTQDYYNGTIIITSNINKISVNDDTIVAECGASINNLCRFALENELSGLEFAYGIPGSIGGGVCMNASAFGGCFAEVVNSSCAFDYDNGTSYELNYEEHIFNNKESIFRKSSLCLLSTKIKLKKGNYAEIKAKMEENLKKRITTQPLDMPSAGSTFIKPKNSYASYLIDQAGLKGYSIGGASVSLKHAGFIVNNGGASAKDVKELIDYIKNVVFDKFSILLKEEIIYLE